MNFLGMGTMEILVVLLVAFIFLGPERMVDAARFLGKLVGEARRMSAEFRDIVLEEEEMDQRAASTTRRSGPEARLGDSMGDSAPHSPASESEEASEGEDGPVAFQPAGGATVQDEAGPKREQEQG